MSKYTKISAISSLSRNGCKIIGKKIHLPPNGLGNSSWGKVDYLEKKHNYFSTFEKPKNKTNLNDLFDLFFDPLNEQRS